VIDLFMLGGNNSDNGYAGHGVSEILLILQSVLLKDILLVFLRNRNITGVWRSLVSVLDWGSRGREFKSPHSDKIIKGLRRKNFVTLFYLHTICIQILTNILHSTFCFNQTY
jgi:hypothetical protein